MKLSTDKKSYILVTAIFLMFLSISAMFIYIVFFRTPQKIAYVDAPKVFNEFILKKELEKQYTHITGLRKSAMDSIDYMLNIITDELNKTDRRDKKADYLEEQQMNLVLKKEEIEKANNAMTEEFDSKIWKQLNQYIQDFSDKYNYDLILGAKGDISVMAANKKNDVTASVISYVNKKYNGEK